MNAHARDYLFTRYEAMQPNEGLMTDTAPTPWRQDDPTRPVYDANGKVVSFTQHAARIVQAVNATSWQPIETALKDKTVQVYSEKYKWMGTNGVQRGFFHSDFNGHKNVMTLDGPGGHVPKDMPTHWMPLPEPPR